MHDPESEPAMDSVVELSGVSKYFGGTTALENVDLTVLPGSVHCLVGENGAGKSTVGKLIAGVYKPDSGVIRVDGRAVNFRSPHDALDHGVAIIAQELALLPARSVEENVFLGAEPAKGGVLSRTLLRKKFVELSSSVGFELKPLDLVRNLRPAAQMQVEILRALARHARVIIMDEPTAALNEEEAESLFQVIGQLRANGTAIVYVTHRLREILKIGDEISIFKDGERVRTGPASLETETSLITGMLGRRLDSIFPAKVRPSLDSPTVLSVRGLSAPPVLRSVDLEVRAGEIIGLAGLMGSGRSETAHAIFGSLRVAGGSTALVGELIEIRSPRQAIERGIALVPESRKTQGLLLDSSSAENVSLVHTSLVSRWGVRRRGAERRLSAQMHSQLDITPPGGDVPVRLMSGGNQQKVLFSKWLVKRPKLLILDEPTHGVDIGTKARIYELINQMASSGVAVIVISSDIVETRGLCHRIYVLADGRVSAVLNGEASEEEVLSAAFDHDIAEEGRVGTTGMKAGAVQ